MKLPSTTFPAVPVPKRTMPLPLLDDTTLPWPATMPPIVVPCAPGPKSMPSAPLCVTVLPTIQASLP